MIVRLGSVRKEGGGDVFCSPGNGDQLAAIESPKDAV
jgi:hypothetical protein